MPATSSFGFAIGSSRGRVRAAVPPSFAPISLFGARCLLFAHANPSSRTSLYISMPGICSIACKRNWVKSDSDGGSDKDWGSKCRDEGGGEEVGGALGPTEPLCFPGNIPQHLLLQEPPYPRTGARARKKAEVPNPTGSRKGA